MDDFGTEVMICIEKLNDSIEKDYDLIRYVYYSGNSDLIKKVGMLDELQIIINQCVQTGNYRRAGKYIIVGNAILKQLENVETVIKNNLTKKVLKLR